MKLSSFIENEILNDQYIVTIDDLLQQLYIKLPYWRLLPIAKPDQVVMEAVRTSFCRMNSQEQIAAIQRLLYLHSYNVLITGHMDVQTLTALRKVNAQASINADTFVDLYVSVPLDSNLYLTLQDSSQKKLHPTSPIAPEAPALHSIDMNKDFKDRPAVKPSQAMQPHSSTSKIESQNTDTYDKVVSMLTALGLDVKPADLSLWTNQNQYLIGDRIHYYFKTGKDCHVIVIGLTTEGKLVQLFPNRYQPKSLVSGGQTYVIMDDQADMTIEVTGPAGQEEIIAFVSEHPFELFPTDFRKQPFFELSNSYEGLRKENSRIQRAEQLNISQKRIQYQIIGR